MEQAKNKARRLILRNLVLGGSATAATKLMPDSWVKPVVNAVMSPAHAQMSEEEEDMPLGATGLYRTGGNNNGNTARIQSKSPLEEFAQNATQNKSVLDYFIKPAHAQQVDACDQVIALIELTFDIPANPGPVDVCANGTLGSTTANGATLADFDVDDRSYSNLTVSETEVAGDVEYPIHGGNVLCTQSFSAPLITGTFSCSVAD